MAGRTFFKTEYDNGALEQSIPFENAKACAYVGICDQTNNPAGQDRKQLNAAFNIIPSECTETVVISLNRNDGVLTVSEA